jgi:hypothetical protein
MARRYTILFILAFVVCAAFSSCDNMAELFHGPKPAVIYTVTFNANGASGTPPEALTVNDGTVINLPDRGSMSSTGNIFAGWNENSSGGGTTYSVGASITVKRNMVFYAQWLDGSTPQFTVTFNANGATGGAAPASQTVYSGISITVPGQGTLAYNGKTFGGWNTQANGGGTNYAVGADFTVTGHVTLYAKWQSVVQYTVTYHVNGASGTAPSAQTVDPGTEITIPGAGSMTYTGRKFDGWNTQANGGGTGYAEGAAYTVNGNVTLYAKWQDLYTVTFNANGASGMAPSAQIVDPGTVITLPGVGSMTNLGKTFEGWNTNAGGTGTDYTEGAAYTVNANATLYAKWASVPIEPPGATWVEKLAYIRSNAGDGMVYDIVVNSNEYIGPQTISTMGRNITVNIHSASSDDIKSIQLESQGNLFSIDTNITLILRDIVLKGISANNKALVFVGQGGKLIMNSGSKVTMNSNNYYNTEHGGGIRVNNGVLELNDGSEITLNIADSRGGGIAVENGGIVNMRGGTISENKAIRDYCGGGGISIRQNCIVTMTGGTISKNSASGGYSPLNGGGIIIDNSSGRFDKRAAPGSSTSGIIYGGTGDNANTAQNGQAIYRAFGTNKQRNSTLGYYDEITSLSEEGWE